ncbi:integumentary mucin C.1-like [Dreissena polymorpha]|uniref:Chitin-binding type-4 domain-containing protein n=1 Tax=Dreissena polymorpha TaxID=45954 RepID=A0A9D4G443_DREPO|nr:integumentary mucin C.1-like [Dreissena polymorpha]KAH3809986.1 hypothetical protein DPMN_138368 [Dreissena polymorpha]
MSFVTLIFTTLVAMATISNVKGHGMLWDPPQRSSAWRFGYDVPKNYNDNEQFCGGAGVQWNQNGGRCGVCGDNYADAVKENEDLNGKYVTGTITGSYVKSANIEVTVRLTANHKGWWEFRLCPLPNSRTKVTQECLDQYLLTTDNGNTRYDLVANQIIDSREFKVGLKLPDNVTCENCVLQWKYNSGNSWSCNSTTCCLGCGPGQENFWNCADIRIVDSGSSGQTTTPTEATTAVSTTETAVTTAHVTTPSPPAISTTPSSMTTTTPAVITTTLQTTTATTASKPTSLPSSTTTSSPSSSSSSSTTTVSSSTTDSKITCNAIGAWFGNSAMDAWCATNCAAGNCPSTYCACTGVKSVCACEPVAPFNVPGMKEWCCKNCALGNCPPTNCSC